MQTIFLRTGPTVIRALTLGSMPALLVRKITKWVTFHKTRSLQDQVLLKIKTLLVEVYTVFERQNSNHLKNPRENWFITFEKFCIH